MEQTVKRRRPYYSHNSPSNKKQRKYALGPGVRGFLCSCNNREKECIRESYNILNKYAELLYGAELSKENESETQQGDFDDDFKREMAALKHESKRRFQLVDSGAKNFLFIRTTLENPVELARAIVTEINRTKQEQTRFLLRLVPVEITCRAYVDDVKKAFEPLVEKHFKDGAKSFSIVFNHRNNNNLSRDVVIREIADMISKQNGQHKVDLKNPDISVVIEVIRGVALLAVVPDYFKYKKYNLHLVCQEGKEVSNAEENVENKQEEENSTEVKSNQVSNAEEKVKSKEGHKADEVSSTEVSITEKMKNKEVNNIDKKVENKEVCKAEEVSSTEVESNEVSSAEKMENKEEANQK